MALPVHRHGPDNDSRADADNYIFDGFQERHSLLFQYDYFSLVSRDNAVFRVEGFPHFDEFGRTQRVDAVLRLAQLLYQSVYVPQGFNLRILGQDQLPGCPQFFQRFGDSTPECGLAIDRGWRGRQVLRIAARQ